MKNLPAVVFGKAGLQRSGNTDYATLCIYNARSIFCLKSCWKLCIVGNLYALDASRNRVWFGAELLFHDFLLRLRKYWKYENPPEKNLFSLWAKQVFFATPSFISVLLFSFLLILFGKITWNTLSYVERGHYRSSFDSLTCNVLKIFKRQ